jgi:urease accessory protein
MQPKVILSAVVTLTSMLAAPLAAAHNGVHLNDGLVDGFMHPVSGLDHLFVAIAAGFWAARAGDHGLRDMSFFLALFAGGLLLGLACQLWPQLDIITTPLLFLLVVAIIAVAIACPSCFMHTLFGSIALWHGLVHMLEMPGDVALAGFAFGLLVSTGVLMSLGLMLRGVIATRRPRDMSH